MREYGRNNEQMTEGKENGVYEMGVRDYAREVSRDVSHSEN